MAKVYSLLKCIHLFKAAAAAATTTCSPFTPHLLMWKTKLPLKFGASVPLQAAGCSLSEPSLQSLGKNTLCVAGSCSIQLNPAQLAHPLEQNYPAKWECSSQERKERWSWKWRVSWRKGGGIREDGERLKLFELSPRLPHSFGILLKSGLLFRPA